MSAFTPFASDLYIPGHTMYMSASAEAFHLHRHLYEDVTFCHRLLISAPFETQMHIDPLDAKPNAAESEKAAMAVPVCNNLFPSSSSKSVATGATVVKTNAHPSRSQSSKSTSVITHHPPTCPTSVYSKSSPTTRS